MRAVTITPKEARALVGFGKMDAQGKASIDETIGLAKKIYRMELARSEFGELRLFQWRGWALSRAIHTDKINGAASGELIPGFVTLSETVRYYNCLRCSLRDPNIDKIEALRESIIRKGYDRTDSFLVAFDGRTPGFYIRDGNHRSIAYLSLVEHGSIEYLPITCVAAREPKVVEFLRDKENRYSFHGMRRS